MSEQRVRGVLRRVLDDLDRRARQAALASALGAGVGLASGCAKAEPAGTPPVDQAKPVEQAEPDAGTVTSKPLLPPPLPPYGVVVPPPPDRDAGTVGPPEADAPPRALPPKGR